MDQQWLSAHFSEDLSQQLGGKWKQSPIKDPVELQWRPWFLAPCDDCAGKCTILSPSLS